LNRIILPGIVPVDGTPFVDRGAELRELERARTRGGLLVVYGRRRVGKTRLLRQWLQGRRGLYSQAIEAQRDQIEQTHHDWKPYLETDLTTKAWAELLEILRLQKGPWVACLDEFPYLTASDGSLPRQLQKWLDHSLPPGCLLVLSGSRPASCTTASCIAARRCTVARGSCCTCSP
jgi:hypothetical protein